MDEVNVNAKPLLPITAANKAKSPKKKTKKESRVVNIIEGSPDINKTVSQTSENDNGSSNTFIQPKLQDDTAAPQLEKKIVFGKDEEKLKTDLQKMREQGTNAEFTELKMHMSFL